MENISKAKVIRGGLPILNATKQGYLIGYEGDGVNINRRMYMQRGNVQRGLSLTIKTSIDVGVICKRKRL